MRTSNVRRGMARLASAASWSPWLSSGALALVLAVALGLRLWKLDASPLWWDEGNNAYFARQTWSGLLEATRLTRDTDPPIHRLALRLWLDVLGDSAYNLRLFSVVCGALTLLLVYHWGVRRGGRSVGLLSAAMLALSPLCVYYAREAKGYPLATLLAALSTYAWAEHVDTRGRSWRAWWLVYALTGALALGTHYYVALLSLAQGLWLVSVSLTEREPGAVGRFLRWGSGQLTMALLLLPWALVTLPTALAGARGLQVKGGPLGLVAYAETVGFALAAGPHASRAVAVGSLAILLLCACWPRGGRSRREWLMASLIIVPVALGYVVQRQVPFVAPRFFLYVTPALFVFVALGMVRMRRGALPAALALAVTWAIAMPSAYTPYAPPEEDLRPLARRLDALARPGDHVAVGYIWQEGIVRMYSPRLPVDYGLGWYTPETVDAQMTDLFAEHARLWLLNYRIPLRYEGNPGGWWLENHAARAFYAEEGHNRLGLYTSPCARPGVMARTATFGERVRCSYEPLRVVAMPGDTLSFGLAWEVSERVDEPITVFVHLMDGAGALQAQSDGLPTNGLVPFSALGPSGSALDCRALLLPADLPPGAYALWVGLYDASTGDRLLVTEGGSTGGDHVSLGSVQVQ